MESPRGGPRKVPRPPGSIASEVCDCILSWVAKENLPGWFLPEPITAEQRVQKRAEAYRVVGE